VVSVLLLPLEFKLVTIEVRRPCEYFKWAHPVGYIIHKVLCVP
jgi:hypothetical protein